uniref:Uncharacterized protein n=1 Tax=viral metagenome TaxID=1070528 RepID=A0A6C0IU60_9ZZZZ
MYRLSFDCGTKHLGVSLCCQHADLPKHNLNKSFLKLKVKKLPITLLDIQSIDLSLYTKKAEKNTSYNISLIKQLHTALTTAIVLPVDVTPENMVVYIEFQMLQNQKTRMIQSALCMFYALYPMVIVKPTLKNRIYFHKKLTHTEYIRKYATSKSANKKHCESNLKYYCDKTGFDYSAITAKLDDPADAFMQWIAYEIHHG